jgi:glycosyltransferase involved in cell wall biosynthesis
VTGFAFAIPGDLERRTGGYAYDRAVMSACRDRSVAVRHLALPGDFPAPSVHSLRETAAAFASVPAACPLLVDGLAVGALPASLLREAGRCFVALVHHPLALESGLAPERVAALRASEQAALAEVRAVIVTSPDTARTLVADYAVPESRITVAVPGVEPAARATGSGAVPLILSVGAVIPRKGYTVLVEALGMLAGRPWQALIVGATDHDCGEATRVVRAIATHRLADRIKLAGERDAAALQPAYAGADIFAAPSLHEGYGMALAEALAHGLPVVASRAGAIPETVPPAAGLLVPPGDASALAQALGHLLDDAALRRRLADAAWRHAAALPRWPQTAATICNVMLDLPPA